MKVKVTFENVKRLYDTLAKHDWKSGYIEAEVVKEEKCGQRVRLGYGVTEDGERIPEDGTCLSEKGNCFLHDGCSPKQEEKCPIVERKHKCNYFEKEPELPGEANFDNGWGIKADDRIVKVILELQRVQSDLIKYLKARE